MTDIKAIIFDFNGVLYRAGEIDKELIDYIKLLKDEYKVAVFTSLDATTLKMYFLSLEKGIFDELYTIDNINGRKPDPSAFMQVARELELKTSECLMIDDSTMNVEGAESVGMSALYYEGLDDLKTALGGLPSRS